MTRYLSRNGHDGDKEISTVMMAQVTSIMAWVWPFIQYDANEGEYKQQKGQQGQQGQQGPQGQQGGQTHLIGEKALNSVYRILACPKQNVEIKMIEQFHTLVLRMLDIACTEPFGPFLQLVSDVSNDLKDVKDVNDVNDLNNQPVGHNHVENDAQRHERERRAHFQVVFTAIAQLCAMHTAVQTTLGLKKVISNVELLLHTRARIVACGGAGRSRLRALGVFAESVLRLCEVSNVSVLTTIVMTYLNVCNHTPACWSICLHSLHDCLNRLMGSNNDDGGGGWFCWSSFTLPSCTC